MRTRQIAATFAALLAVGVLAGCNDTTSGSTTTPSGSMDEPTMDASPTTDSMTDEGTMDESPTPDSMTDEGTMDESPTPDSMDSGDDTMTDQG